MTDKAKELLQKMASAYDDSQRSSFDSMFYLGYSDKVINELESLECITRKNDIVASIILTKIGYEEAKK